MLFQLCLRHLTNLVVVGLFTTKMIEEFVLKSPRAKRVLHNGVSKLQTIRENDEARSWAFVCENGQPTRVQNPDDNASYARWRKQTTHGNDEPRAHRCSSFVIPRHHFGSFAPGITAAIGRQELLCVGYISKHGVRILKWSDVTC